jgi:hypothetical protein
MACGNSYLHLIRGQKFNQHTDHRKHNVSDTKTDDLYLLKELTCFCEELVKSMDTLL